VSHALLSGCIACFGYLQTIRTDQGRKFQSQIFHSLAKICGIHLSRTTPPPLRSQRPRGASAQDTEFSHHVSCGQVVDHGHSTGTTRHTHRLQVGLAVIYGRARLRPAPSGAQCAPCTSRPEGRGIHLHTATPPQHGPAATNPSSTRCIPGHIHSQGSPEIDPLVLQREDRRVCVPVLSGGELDGGKRVKKWCPHICIC